MCQTLVYRWFVSIQVFTGAVPLHDRTRFAAGISITQGWRPPRPIHPAFTESLWRLMQRCWQCGPRFRPEVSEVLQAFRASSVSHPCAQTLINSIVPSCAVKLLLGNG